MEEGRDTTLHAFLGNRGPPSRREAHGFLGSRGLRDEKSTVFWELPKNRGPRDEKSAVSWETEGLETRSPRFSGSSQKVEGLARDEKCQCHGFRGNRRPRDEKSTVFWELPKSGGPRFCEKSRASRRKVHGFLGAARNIGPREEEWTMFGASAREASASAGWSQRSGRGFLFGRDRRCLL